MRVLVTFLSFGKNVFGGIERATYNLALGLKSVGADVFVYTGKAYTTSGKLDGIKIYGSSYLQRVFTGKDEAIFAHYEENAASIQKEFHGLCGRLQPDLVICVDHLWGILPVLNIEPPCRTVLWLHVAHNTKLMRRALNSRMELYAVSQCLIAELRQHTHKHIKLLPNSIIYDSFQRRRVRKPIILCNARISPEKRVIDAVKAFRRFWESHREYSLHLCRGGFPFGSTNMSLNEINRYLARYPQLKVVFHENLKWNEVPRLLATCTAVILPSAKETFGLAALEAMASGTPLVVTRAGNIPLLVGKCTVPIDIGNIGKLAAGLIAAVKREAGLNLGRAIARRYDYIDVGRSFIKAFN